MTSEAGNNAQGRGSEAAIADVYQQYEGYAGIRDHVQNARGVADTNPRTRDMVEPIDKLLKDLGRKMAPLEKKLEAARANARARARRA